MSVEKCPQCGSNVIQPRNDTDYCEDCGWPDENRLLSEVEELRAENDRLRAELAVARMQITGLDSDCMDAKDDLAAARAESDKWKDAYRVRCQLAAKDTNDAVGPVREDLIAARADCSRLRGALEYLSNSGDHSCWCNTPVCVNQPGCERAREALSTATASVPTVPLAEAEALARALNDAIQFLKVYAAPKGVAITQAADSLAAYRTRRPAPAKEYRHSGDGDGTT